MTTPREPDLSNSELRDRWREFQATRDRARDLAGDLDERQLWWRPDGKRWSVGECLDHLVLAGQAYLDVIDEAVAKGRRKGLTADGPPRRSRLGDLLAHAVEPPARLKVPAPASIRPRRPAPGDTGDLARPLARFVGLREPLARRLDAADGLALGRVRVRSPFVPLVTVNLDSALRIMTGHERRHLWQARRVREDEAFPTAPA